MNSTITETPRAWVGCLSCYNSGSLFGKWIPGIELLDLEAAGLVRCVRCFGDEFCVMDHENFGGLITGECSPAEAAAAAEFIAGLERENIETAAACAWLSFTGRKLEEWDLDSFQDSYCGEYNSFEEYAEELALELYGKELEEARWPFSCIDWERAARDLSHDYFTETAPSGGEFIFRAC